MRLIFSIISLFIFWYKVMKVLCRNAFMALFFFAGVPGSRLILRLPWPGQALRQAQDIVSTDLIEFA